MSALLRQGLSGQAFLALSVRKFQHIFPHRTVSRLVPSSVVAQSRFHFVELNLGVLTDDDCDSVWRMTYGSIDSMHKSGNRQWVDHAQVRSKTAVEAVKKCWSVVGVCRLLSILSPEELCPSTAVASLRRILSLRNAERSGQVMPPEAHSSHTHASRSNAVLPPGQTAAYQDDVQRWLPSRLNSKLTQAEWHAMSLDSFGYANRRGLSVSNDGEDDNLTKLFTAVLNSNDIDAQVETLNLISSVDSVFSNAEHNSAMAKSVVRCVVQNVLSEDNCGGASLMCLAQCINQIGMLCDCKAHNSVTVEDRAHIRQWLNLLWAPLFSELDTFAARTAIDGHDLIDSYHSAALLPLAAKCVRHCNDRTVRHVLQSKVVSLLSHVWLHLQPDHVVSLITTLDDGETTSIVASETGGAVWDSDSVAKQWTPILAAWLLRNHHQIRTMDHLSTIISHFSRHCYADHRLVALMDRSLALALKTASQSKKRVSGRRLQRAADDRDSVDNVRSSAADLTTAILFYCQQTGCLSRGIIRSALDCLSMLCGPSLCGQSRAELFDMTNTSVFEILQFVIKSAHILNRVGDRGLVARGDDSDSTQRAWQTIDRCLTHHMANMEPAKLAALFAQIALAGQSQRFQAHMSALRSAVAFNARRDIDEDFFAVNWAYAANSSGLTRFAIASRFALFNKLSYLGANLTPSRGQTEQLLACYNDAHFKANQELLLYTLGVANLFFGQDVDTSLTMKSSVVVHTDRLRHSIDVMPTVDLLIHVEKAGSKTAPKDGIPRIIVVRFYNETDGIHVVEQGLPKQGSGTIPHTPFTFLGRYATENEIIRSVIQQTHSAPSRRCNTGGEVTKPECDIIHLPYSEWKALTAQHSKLEQQRQQDGEQEAEVEKNLVSAVCKFRDALAARLPDSNVML